MSGRRPKEFPNSWQKFKDTDSQFFMNHFFDEVMEWKVLGWELPSNIYCIIRATHLKTKKISEFVYQNPKCADKRITSFFKDKTHELCITTHDSQHYVGPNPPSSYDDDDFSI